MKFLVAISMFVSWNASFGQIDFKCLAGSWTACVNLSSTDTLYMVPSGKIDSSCSQTYQNGYWIRHILTQFDFTDSVTVVLTTSSGSTIDENAPREDTTHMTVTIVYDTIWTESQEIEKVVETKIETPRQIQYAAGTSSMTIEHSGYSIDFNSAQLTIDQGDRELNYRIIKLSAEELVLKNL